MPIMTVGDLLHTMAISGLSRVRTRAFQLTVVQTLTPHPVPMTASWRAIATFAIFPSAAHGRWKKLAPPLPFTADRDLRRFDQQDRNRAVACVLMCPRRRRPLDSSAGTRLHSCDLLATTETCGSSNHPLEATPSLPRLRDASSVRARWPLSTSSSSAASSPGSFESVGRISRAGLDDVAVPRERALTIPFTATCRRHNAFLRRTPSFQPPQATAHKRACASAPSDANATANPRGIFSPILCIRDPRSSKTIFPFRSFNNNCDPGDRSLLPHYASYESPPIPIPTHPATRLAFAQPACVSLAPIPIPTFRSLSVL